MLEVMQRTGLKCASISGTAEAGRGSGLTKPGAEKAYLDEIKDFGQGCQENGRCAFPLFPRRAQQDLSWETQRANLVKDCGWREISLKNMELSSF